MMKKIIELVCAESRMILYKSLTLYLYTNNEIKNAYITLNAPASVGVKDSSIDSTNTTTIINKAQKPL